MTDTSKETRKGIKIYLDYFDCEFEDLTDAQVGQLLRGLYEYDRFGEPQKYKEVINSERVVRTVFKTMCKNHDRAVASWERKRNYWKNKKGNKSNNEDEEDIPEEETTDIDQDEMETINYPVRLKDGIEYIFTITFPNRNKYNVPSLYDIAGIEDGDSTIEDVLNRIDTMIDKGNSDNWNKHWMAYHELPDIV